MNQHKKTFKALVGSLFPVQLAEMTYPTDPNGKNTVYIEPMDNVREPNVIFQEIEKDYMELDGVFTLFPSQERQHGHRVLNVAIEIKTNLKDLKKDHKMVYYLGTTDLFFLVVPYGLIPDAIRKIRSFGERIPYFGLVEATSGEIVIMPAMQDAIKDKDRESRVLAKIYLTKRRVERPEACYLVRSLELGTHRRPEFVSLAGMNVNRDYFKVVSNALPEDPL